MTWRGSLLVVPLCLAGCQAVAPEQPQTDWSGWMAEVNAMDAPRLEHAQAEALRQYTINPSNENRLRAGYALSRPGASPAQLDQARGVIEPIPPETGLAGYRDLLEEEIRLRLELQRAEQRLTEQQLEAEKLNLQTAELQRRIEGLLTEVRSLQTQLETLKAIEEDMVETQQQTDDAQR